MSVTPKEIVEALIDENSVMFRTLLADRIKTYGIAPPDGYVLVNRELLEDTCELLDLLGLVGDDCYQALKAMLSAVKENE